MATILGLMPADLGAVQFINALLVSVGVGISLLSDIAQNGNSPLGVLPGPVLPPYLGGPGHDNVPWGNRTANGTNYYVDIPDTGVTRFYDLTISRGRIAPDGFEKNVILVNGQFPGPLLEANWGDYFKITVRNNISEPTEGTTLHWHGYVIDSSSPRNPSIDAFQAPTTRYWLLRRCSRHLAMPNSSGVGCSTL